MKRRIFNVLFALVLALSLSLVTAVPVAADPATFTVVPFELQPDGEGTTAEWSTNANHTGSWGVNIGTATDGTGAGRVAFAWNQNLSTITDMSYWYNLQAGNGAPNWDSGPYMNIEIDTDDDDVTDAWVLHKMFFLSPGIGTWLQWKLSDDPIDSQYMEHNSTDMWHVWDGSAMTDYALWSDVLAVHGDDMVKKIKIAVGDWASDIETRHYVDDIQINGVTYYGKIQDAIDTASSSDTINVAAGTYTEDLKIDNKTGITLRSENGKDVTTITTTAKPGIEIQGSATGFTLGGASGQGFTIDGTAGHLIVLSNNPSGVTISYNEIDTTGIASRGISVGVAGATSLTVSNNTFTADSGDGSLSAWDGPTVDVTVSGNEFEGGSYAVQFSGVTSTSGDSTISGNNITGYTGAGAIVITNGTGTSDLVISGNEVTDCTHGVRFEEECIYGTPGAMTAVTVNGNTITDSSSTGIRIGYGTGLNITGNNISGCPKGVEFAADTDAEMENNTFANNTYNIYHAAEIVTGGSSFYGNIQDAIEAADPRETILVYAGSYTESLSIDKSLTVQSEEGVGMTELKGYVEIELGWDGEDPLAEMAVFDGFYIEEEAINIYEVNNGSSLTISKNELAVSYIYCGEDTLDNGSTITIEGNEIFNFEGPGIYFEDIAGGSDLIIRDNAIYDNDFGIYIDSVAEDSTVTIVGNIVGGYEDEYVEYGGNYFSGIIVGYVMDSTLTIGGDTEAEANIIGGNGLYDGEEAAGIFIYETDNTTVAIQGNIIGAYECEEYITWGNYWAGISLWYINDSTILIGGDTRAEGNIISENDQEGIYVDELEASSLEILNNDILNNVGDGSGIDLRYMDEYSTVDIHFNSIAGNVYGVLNYSPYTIDATRNWWGDVTGPSHLTNPYYPTSGDAISNVDYIPWLIQSDLAEDWNIWSRPIAPGENSWEQMQAELVEDGVKAFYFYYFDVESSTQVWGNDPDEAGLLDAFYIKMPAESRIRYCISDEATFPGVKEMAVGWNFIGLTELYGMGLDDALYDAYWGTGQTGLIGYSKVISPFLNEYSWLYQRGLDEPWTVYPTEGYWVFMVNDGTLGGFTLTPVVEVENGP